LARLFSPLDRHPAHQLSSQERPATPPKAEALPRSIIKQAPTRRSSPRSLLRLRPPCRSRKAQRRWIASTSPPSPIAFKPLDDATGPESAAAPLPVIGEPTDVAAAAHRRTKYQFPLLGLGLCRSVQRAIKRRRPGSTCRSTSTTTTPGTRANNLLRQGGHTSSSATSSRPPREAPIRVWILESPPNPEPSRPSRLLTPQRLIRRRRKSPAYRSSPSRPPRSPKSVQRPLHVRDTTFRKAPRSRPTPPKPLLNLSGDGNRIALNLPLPCRHSGVARISVLAGCPSFAFF